MIRHTSHNFCLSIYFISNLIYTRSNKNDIPINRKESRECESERSNTKKSNIFFFFKNFRVFSYFSSLLALLRCDNDLESQTQMNQLLENGIDWIIYYSTTGSITRMGLISFSGLLQITTLDVLGLKWKQKTSNSNLVTVHSIHFSCCTGRIYWYFVRRFCFTRCKNLLFLSFLSPSNFSLYQFSFIWISSIVRNEGNRIDRAKRA